MPLNRKKPADLAGFCVCPRGDRSEIELFEEGAHGGFELARIDRAEVTVHLQFDLALGPNDLSRAGLSVQFDRSLG